MPEKLAAPATSLVKALDVLLALEQSPAGRGVTDIARALGLPKSAVHRLLVTFQACGFVQQQTETSRYTLGPVLARLGLRAADLFTPRRVARPAMEALAHEVGETIFLGVLCEESVLVVEKVEHNQVLRISPELGTTLPLRQTALGQVWLACCPVAQREVLLATLVAPESVIPAERVLAQSLAGAARVQEFHRQLFNNASEALRQEIKRITGVEVRDAAVEIEPATGTLLQVFTTGTMVQVFLLAGDVPVDSWSQNEPDNPS